MITDQTHFVNGLLIGAWALLGVFLAFDIVQFSLAEVMS
jgi:hypothetical protein